MSNYTAGVIGLVQVKGGSGRSTIAVNLAAELSKKHPTALIDTDHPQGTAAGWFVTREEAGRADGLTLALAARHKELAQQVEALKAGHRYVVIDSPPRIAEMTRASLILSDLALIPIGPSIADLWSTQDLLPTVEEAQAVRPQIDARLIWTRYRGYTQEAAEMSEAVKREMSLKEIKTRLGYRTAYSRALAQGRSAAEWSDPVARDEVSALTAEVTAILRRK